MIDILEECAEKARTSGSSKIFGQNEAQHRNLVSKWGSVENGYCIYFYISGVNSIHPTCRMRRTKKMMRTAAMT